MSSLFIKICFCNFFYSIIKFSTSIFIYISFECLNNYNKTDNHIFWKSISIYSFNYVPRLNIVIEKSIGLTSSGKQFSISKKLSNENLFTSEAIFLLSYQNFEPIKLKSKQKTFVGNSIVVR